MCKVVDISEQRTHYIAEIICVKCLSRWIAVVPCTVLLKEIECPYCMEVGYAIKTGQTLED